MNGFANISGSSKVKNFRVSKDIQNQNVRKLI
jgi:hypothetical protein